MTDEKVVNLEPTDVYFVRLYHGGACTWLYCCPGTGTSAWQGLTQEDLFYWSTDFPRQFDALYFITTKGSDE